MRHNAIRRRSERNVNDNKGFGISLSRNQTAAGLMLGYVVLQSLVPLFVAFGAGESPFIFSAAWRIGGLMGCALILRMLFHKMLFSGEVWKVVGARALRFAMILWVVASLNLVLYAWSTQFVDVSVAAALYETWPIFLVIFTGWLFRLEARYRKITQKTIFPFVFALIGIASVIVSQAGGFGSFFSADTGWINLAIGVALAFGAVGLSTLSAFGFRWAADLASELSESPDNREPGKGRLELFSTAVGLTICNLTSLPFIASVGFMLNEPISSDALIWGATGGVLVAAVGMTLWRMANLIASNLGINVMGYLAPALALGWLFAFSRVGDIDFWPLVIGVVLIIGANWRMYIETREQPQELVDAQAREPIDIDALIAGGESDTVEFKSTLRFNLDANKIDKDNIGLASLKEIAAFLNSRVGGTLIIGVADDGEPVGIGKDNFQNEDRMAQHLTNLVRDRMTTGAVTMARGLVRWEFYDYRGSRVLSVRCEPAAQPTYVNNNRFYVRTGPSTQELSGQDEFAYIRERFPDWDGA